MLPEIALACAEKDYQKANIDLRIQEHLAANSEEPSVKSFADFIMATDIGLFILASVKIIFHLAFSTIYQGC